MSNVQDIVDDVADALNVSNGCKLDDKDQKKILKGIKRVLDRFSIDARKLPTVCQIEHTLKDCDTRLSIGNGKRFDVWGSPVEIHYAAWKHSSGIRYSTGNTILGGLCEEPIKVNLDPGQFHHFSMCRNLGFGRPTEMYFQKGEIVFNSRPFAGDTLLLRAVMPFDDQLLSCCSDDHCDRPEYDFRICPDHLLDYQSRESILCQSRDLFDGTDCWEGRFTAYPCGDECAQPIDVKVTAVKVQEFCPHKIGLGEMDLPAGYYDALVRILTYDLAKFFQMPRDSFMRQDRNDAIKILHRSNNRVKPFERDLTTPWSKRRGSGIPANICSETPRGTCG